MEHALVGVLSVPSGNQALLPLPSPYGIPLLGSRVPLLGFRVPAHMRLRPSFEGRSLVR